jgi:hypothetical protein
MGEAAGGGGKKKETPKGKGKERKEQRTELTKGNSLTEDTPQGAVVNALRLHLHLHNYAYGTSKKNTHKHKHTEREKKKGGN